MGVHAWFYYNRDLGLQVPARMDYDTLHIIMIKNYGTLHILL